MKPILFDKLKDYNQIPGIQQPGQPGQVQGVNPFGNENPPNEGNVNLDGISPVAQETEPEFDLTGMSMELQDDSSGSSNNEEEEKKKQKEITTLAGQ